MHLGIDDLTNIIRYRLTQNLCNGSLYAFCDDTGTNLKYIEWDGIGFCIAKRRTQSGSYPWPSSETGLTVEITEREFEFLKFVPRPGRLRGKVNAVAVICGK